MGVLQLLEGMAEGDPSPARFKEFRMLAVWIVRLSVGTKTPSAWALRRMCEQLGDGDVTAPARIGELADELCAWLITGAPGRRPIDRLLDRTQSDEAAPKTLEMYFEDMLRERWRREAPEGARYRRCLRSLAGRVIRHAGERVRQGKLCHGRRGRERTVYHLRGQPLALPRPLDQGKWAGEILQRPVGPSATGAARWVEPVLELLHANGPTWKTDVAGVLSRVLAAEEHARFNAPLPPDEEEEPAPGERAIARAMEALAPTLNERQRAMLDALRQHPGDVAAAGRVLGLQKTAGYALVQAIRTRLAELGPEDVRRAAAYGLMDRLPRTYRRREQPASRNVPAPAPLPAGDEMSGEWT